MTIKDKLEIGLKEDAPYRKDNLPDSEVTGPEIPAGPGRSPEIPAARKDVTESDVTDVAPLAPPASPQSQPGPTAKGRSPQPPIEPRS